MPSCLQCDPIRRRFFRGDIRNAEVANDPKTKYALWVLPLEGEKKPLPFLRTAFNEADGRFSPDGHWVAIVRANPAATRMACYAMRSLCAGTGPRRNARWR
jgi:hypothetical protein